MKHISVYVVLLQRTLLLDAAGPLEVLRVANREQQDIRFEVHYIGPETSVVSSIGITLAKIEPLPKTLPDGAMVVLSGDVDYMMMPGMQIAPRQVGDRDAAVVKWLRTVVRPGHKVVSICSGALLAGKAGLLDGYTCTTHHSSCAELAANPPKAKVLENRLFVEDRERYSSAGVTTGVDLMLHIVAQAYGSCAGSIHCAVHGGVSAPQWIGSATFAVAGGAQPYSSGGSPGTGRDYGRPNRGPDVRRAGEDRGRKQQASHAAISGVCRNEHYGL